MKIKLPKNLSPRLIQSEPIERCCLDDCKAACCLYGVWIDQLHWEIIWNASSIIIPEMRIDAKDPEEWWDKQIEKDETAPSGKVFHTRVRIDENHYGGTSCVFLRADSKCALQTAAEKAGFHPWHFKPFYCILHPLDIDSDGRITLDNIEDLLKEKGSCVRASTNTTPLLKTFGPELRYFLGSNVYDRLEKHINHS